MSIGTVEQPALTWNVSASRTRGDRRIYFDWKATEGVGVAFTALTVDEALELADALRTEAEWVRDQP